MTILGVIGSEYLGRETVRQSTAAGRRGTVTFLTLRGGPMTGHVTMHVGDDQMTDAPPSGEVVRIDPADTDYYASPFAEAVRPT